MKKLITILTCITLSIAILTGVYSHDQSLARATDVLVIREQIKLIHKRFESEQRVRRAQVVQERLWTLSDRYEGKVMPVSVREEARLLKAELARLRGE